MTKTAACLLLSLGCAAAQEYKLGPDSMRQPAVPQGKVTKYSWTSRIYPGTTRDYWVYAPAQYKSSKPAALAVFQDGASFVAEDGAWRTPVVFDNLIQRGEIPVMIGVFIDPGVLPPDHANRSFEYDTVTDRYSRFLLEEILPQVAKNYNISKDPNDRLIGGSSSGGICAFTVAWQRPDQFRRVLSFVGSFVNLRGGEMYSSMVRKTEPKPIRVFLQDGEKDLNIAAGNWFIGAHDMLSALEYGGYDVTHVWGVEAHNSKHGGAILPYALRWIWRGYPVPIAKPTGGGGERQWSVLLTAPGTDWEVASQGHKSAAGLTADQEGNVFFSDAPGELIYKIGVDGAAAVFKEHSGGDRALLFGMDGRLYASQDDRERVVSYSASGKGNDGKEKVFAEHITANGMAFSSRGEMYVTDAAHKRIWSIGAKGKRVVHEGISSPTGVLFSSNRAFLIVNDSASRGIWWFQVQPDGGLANGDSIYRLEAPDESTATEAGGMAIDSEGFLYVATNLGIQVFDPQGRVMAILQPPQPRVSSLAFGGPKRDILYVTAGDKVFRRSMRGR
jgi:sugar lactone lactonase YvrE/predicted alpha/beta superfamily hydrolase